MDPEIVRILLAEGYRLLASGGGQIAVAFTVSLGFGLWYRQRFIVIANPDGDPRIDIQSDPEGSTGTISDS